MKVLGITMGDPAGVGPEIIVKALEDKEIRKKHTCIVYGAVDILQYYIDMLHLDCHLNAVGVADEARPGMINVLDPAGLKRESYPLGKVSPCCGDAAFRYIEKAVQDALAGKIEGIVTAPLNKEALHLGGHLYDGHTEILAALTDTKKYAMFFYGPLKVIHVSTHCSLRDACDRVKKERVLDCIEMADATLKQLGVNAPVIAVAGLNPHAGEHGIFGWEETREIIPAVQEAKHRGILAEGPIPADTVYMKALNGKYDAVVAMYHDQGHIPAKLELMDECVNCTVGLPVIRTSVDHGTAFDIAGQGIANAENMKKAIQVAEKFLNNFPK